MPRNKPSPGARRKSRKRVSARAGRAKKPMKTGGRKAATFSGKPRPGKPSPRPEKGVAVPVGDLTDAQIRASEGYQIAGRKIARTKECLIANSRLFNPSLSRPEAGDLEADPFYAQWVKQLHNVDVAASAFAWAIQRFESVDGPLANGVRNRLALCMEIVWYAAFELCLYNQVPVQMAEFKARSEKSRKLNERKREKNRLDERDDKVYRRFTELKKEFADKGSAGKIYETLAEEFEAKSNDISNAVRNIYRIIRRVEDRMQS
jgi:hypothetical protein